MTLRHKAIKPWSLLLELDSNKILSVSINCYSLESPDQASASLVLTLHVTQCQLFCMRNIIFHRNTRPPNCKIARVISIVPRAYNNIQDMLVSAGAGVRRPDGGRPAAVLHLQQLLHRRLWQARHRGRGCGDQLVPHTLPCPGTGQTFRIVSSHF